MYNSFFNVIQDIWLILEKAGVGLIIFDAKTHRIVEVNPCAVKSLGYEASEILNLTIDQLLGIHTMSVLENAYEPFEKDIGQTTEIKCNKKDGTWINIEITSIKIKFRHLDCFLVMTREISKRKNEELFRAIFEKAAVGIVIADLEGRPQESNHAFQEMIGYNANELRGMIFAEFTHPDDIGADMELHRDLVAGNRGWFQMEKRYIRKDGKILYVRLSISLVGNENGEPNSIIGMAEDITETKRAQESLLNTHKQLLGVIEFLPDATLVINRDKKVIAWNRAMEEMTGIPKEEMIGKGDHAYAVPFYGSMRPILIDLIFSDNWETKKNYARFERKGDKLYAENFIPTAFKGKGAYLSASASPLFDSEGDIVGAIQIIRDITEHNQMNEALREAHNQIKQLLVSVSSVIIAVDTEDRVIQWNHAAKKTFGIKEADVIGKQFSMCGIIWDWVEVLEYISKCKEKDQKSLDIKYTRPDGSEGLFGITVNPINSESGMFSGFVLLGEDITEKRNEETHKILSQKLESIGQMAAGIAHEINTPMQYISNNTSFLKDAFTNLQQLYDVYIALINKLEQERVYSDIIAQIREKENKLDIEYLLKEIPEAISQSLEGINRVSKLVLAMKDFSHSGGKEKMLSDINRGIENTVAISRNEWKYIAELDIVLERNLPLVYCCIDETNQVILNMIINATHAIKDAIEKQIISKGKIKIQTQSQGGFVKIFISDNGIGIPQSIINKIYDPFFTTKEVGKGTGQGLAIAHDIIFNKHKGSIHVQSEVGKGTVLTISLPVADHIHNGESNHE